MPLGNTRNRNAHRNRNAGQRNAGQAPGKPQRPQKSNRPGSGSTLANAKRSYERYLALANNSATHADPIEIENFSQHAEHYFRLMNEYGHKSEPA